MTRQPRRPSPTGWFHLINRGADKQDTFSTDADYAAFERLIGEASESASIEVHAYCLMTNHFHLVVRADGDGTAVSTFMHDLSAPYAVGYNQRNGRSGPLFEGRYRSIGVSDQAHLTGLGRYVHRNPLVFVPPNALDRYRWSSLRVYCGGQRGPHWLRTDVLGADITAERYRAFVIEPMPSDRVDPMTWALAPTPSLAAVESVIAHRTGQDPSALRATSGRPNTGRMLAVMLAVELRIADARTLAERYGFSSADAVRALARRGRVRSVNEPAFERLHAAVVGEVRRAA